jgi:hypothetical protein
MVFLTQEHIDKLDFTNYYSSEESTDTSDEPTRKAPYFQKWILDFFLPLL